MRVSTTAPQFMCELIVNELFHLSKKNISHIPTTVFSFSFHIIFKFKKYLHLIRISYNSNVEF